MTQQTTSPQGPEYLLLSLLQDRVIGKSGHRNPGFCSISVISVISGKVFQRKQRSSAAKDFAAYPNSSSIEVISDSAWRFPVRWADSIPRLSIVLASSARSAFTNVWAAMKYPLV